MSINERNPNQTQGTGRGRSRTDAETTIVALATGGKIEVCDAVWSRDNSLLKLQIDGRGIDVTVPREHVEAVIKTQAGAEVFN